MVGSARLQAGPRPESVANRPKLAVLVVFDQLRGDYPARWRSLFGEGGFERLLTEGAWFAECHYPYASTVTGAGHASMGTGVTPRVHGVIGNDWFDRAQGSKVYCATLGDRYQRVPSRAAGSGGRGGSPERLLVPALGDGIKQRDPPGKVVAMSLKDRGGVLIAGHRADAVYWFDDADGQFVTSTFYRAAPHDWAKAFNDRRVPDRWFGTQWERLRPDVDYTAHAGPDVGPGEGSGVEQGVAFPHSMSGGMTEPGPRSYQALYNSPFGNDLLWEFAKAAIEGERLGQGAASDLLSISFSSNDAVGHTWGPDSHEVLDITLRSDRLMRDMLDYLDGRLGRGQYVLVVCSDHGVVPLPERSAAQGIETGRVSASRTMAALERHLQEKLGRGENQGRWILTGGDMDVYLNERTLTAHGVPRATVEAEAKTFLESQTGILRVFTRTEMVGPMPANDELAQRVWRGFHPDRSGDLYVVIKPYFYPSSRLTGTGHGTPHPYDTHVPLLVYGAGVRTGVRADAVTPLAAASILAEVLGVKLAPEAEAVPPDLLTLPAVPR